MTVTAFNDALNKLQQKARRRRLLGEPIFAYTPTVETTKPPIKMIVSDWLLTNSAIKRASSRRLID